jgi:hypothetical protein
MAAPSKARLGTRALLSGVGAVALLGAANRLVHSAIPVTALLTAAALGEALFLVAVWRRYRFLDSHRPKGTPPSGEAWASFWRVLEALEHTGQSGKEFVASCFHGSVHAAQVTRAHLEELCCYAFFSSSR